MFGISELPFSPILASSSADIDDGDLSNLRDELPSYSVPGPSVLHRHTSRERQLHEFTLESSDRKPWACLRLRSWAPSAKSLPVFMENQDVSGHIELNLREAESIKSVNVTIKGFVRTQNRETNFFHVSETLWDSHFGDPRSPNQQNRTKYTGKLKGTYSWPFSITLPHEIPVEPKIARELKLNLIERLPPSLDGLDWNSVINYRLTVNIKRRGILKSDSSISTLIGYTPTTHPEPPSPARRKAYREKTSIPGPVFDPNGWRILQDIKFSGTLFKQRNVAVTYTLALATPLAYTRGTVIPCHLTIRSPDNQALALLSSPSAPRITLRRKLTARMVVTPSERIDLTALRKEDSQRLAKAIWAPSERRQNECTLMGELSIPLACTPTFSFGEFKLEYFIDVYPPVPAGFQPLSDEVLSSTMVQVVSAYAEGSSRPRAYITPAYDVSQRVAQADTLGRHMAALALERTSSALESSRPSIASPSLGEVSPPRFATFGTARDEGDVIRSATPSSPAGSRRLNRRFSAI